MQLLQETDKFKTVLQIYILTIIFFSFWLTSNYIQTNWFSSKDETVACKLFDKYSTTEKKLDYKTEWIKDDLFWAYPKLTIVNSPVCVD